MQEVLRIAHGHHDALGPLDGNNPEGGEGDEEDEDQADEEEDEDLSSQMKHLST